MRILLVTTMRNEGAFMLDWVAHHRALGVTDLLIFTNDCDDGTDLIAARLEALGLARHILNPRGGEKPIQWQALAAASKHPDFAAADWVIAADVDEYLVVHAGAGRLADLFAARPEATGFAVPWRLFGNDGVREISATPVPERFTRAAPPVLLWPFRARCYKAIWRNDGVFRKIGVHRPQGVERDRYQPATWVDGSGAPVPQDITKGMLPALLTETDQYGLAQWNHYVLGSAEDFLLKAWRGKPNHENEAIALDYWVANNLNSVVDESILPRRALSSDLRAELFADAELNELHQRALAWRKAKVAELLQQEAWLRLYCAVRSAGSTQVLPIEEQRALLRHHARVVRRQK
ncbi:MAG: glycosyltransferase family 2 protein [Pseudomonadota bacterium]